MNKPAFILLSAIAFVSSNVFALGDATKGQAKSAACIACHFVDGNSVVPMFPKLAGQSEAYLTKQLKDFKSGLRKDALMAGIVASLTDEDMDNLSAYFAKQKISKGASLPGANLKLGEKIYRGGKKSTSVTACIACHGPTGAGIPSAGFPALTAQHAPYVVKQLKAFRQNSINAQTGASEPSRANDNRDMMINFTKSLTNQEIDAVAQYIAGLY